MLFVRIFCSISFHDFADHMYVKADLWLSSRYQSKYVGCVYAYVHMCFFGDDNSGMGVQLQVAHRIWWTFVGQFLDWNI